MPVQTDGSIRVDCHDEDQIDEHEHEHEHGHEHGHKHEHGHDTATTRVGGVSRLEFLTPHQKNFPLMGLPGKKVALLDEWRFNDAILAYPEQMQW